MAMNVTEVLIAVFAAVAIISSFVAQLTTTYHVLWLVLALGCTVACVASAFIADHQVYVQTFR
jgi:hypothetical protein